MQVSIDALIYCQQPRGGITRVLGEILPRMCAMDETLRFEMWTRGALAQELPAHERIRRRPLPALDGALWRTGPAARMRPFLQQALFDLHIGRGRNAVWHFTYSHLGLPRRWRGAVVMTVFDMLFEVYPDHYRAYSERFLAHRAESMRMADQLLCISEATRDDLCRITGIDAARTTVIPLACSDAFRPLGDTIDPASKPYLLYVGGRYWHKNFDLLLRAFAAWPRRNDFEIVVAGTEPTRRDLRALAESGVQDRVRHVGIVSDERLCALYNHAAAFLHTSRHEGFGIPLVEAMACGCPIVASRIPSTVEVAADVPWTFESDSADSLLAALDAALDAGRADARIAKGRRRAATFSWDRTARMTLDAYRRVR